jgi:hypothetical protein
MFRPLRVNREGLEVVYRAQGMLAANVIKGRLEASGIPAVLDHESQVWGMVIDELGEVRVLVPADQADQARELLEIGDDEEKVEDLPADDDEQDAPSAADL